MSSRSLLSQFERALSRAGAPSAANPIGPTARRVDRRKLLPLLSTAVFAGGCYRWVPVPLAEVTHSGVEGSVLRVTAHPDRLQLSQPRVVDQRIEGVVDHVEDVASNVARPTRDGERVSRSLLEVQRVERRAINGGTVAAVTATCVGVAIVGGVLGGFLYGSTRLNIGGGWGSTGGYGLGRRPEGLVEDDATEYDGSLGAFFARCAELEAASVPAFARLASELAAWSAPPPLVRAAERSALEELRHAEQMSALASRFGRSPNAVTVRPPNARSLRDLAEENAVEGCVHESFGALLALWQSRTSTDPVVRDALTSIARDETRHAALSKRVDHWAQAQLSPEERRHIDAARARAVDALCERGFDPVRDELRSVAGLPDEAARVRLALAARTVLLSGGIG